MLQWEFTVSLCACLSLCWSHPCQHPVGLPPPKLVNVSDGGVAAKYRMPPFASHEVAILTYDSRTGHFVEKARVSRDTLPITVRLQHGYFYVLRLFGVFSGGLRLPLRDQEENLAEGKYILLDKPFSK